MKIPQVCGVDPIIKSWRDGTGTIRHSYHVELYRQPLHRWLAARIYRWYDMWICRVPGFQLLEAVKGWRYRNRDLGEYLPVSAVQDIRCFDLHQRGKTVFATFEVPVEVYEQAAGRPSPV